MTVGCSENGYGYQQQAEVSCDINSSLAARNNCLGDTSPSVVKRSTLRPAECVRLARALTAGGGARRLSALAWTVRSVRWRFLLHGQSHGGQRAGRPTLAAAGLGVKGSVP